MEHTGCTGREKSCHESVDLIFLPHSQYFFPDVCQSLHPHCVPHCRQFHPLSRYLMVQSKLFEKSNNAKSLHSLVKKRSFTRSRNLKSPSIPSDLCSASSTPNSATLVSSVFLSSLRPVTRSYTSTMSNWYLTF